MISVLLSLVLLLHALAVYNVIYRMVVGIWCTLNAVTDRIDANLHLDALPLLESEESREILSILLFVTTAFMSAVAGILVFGIDPNKIAEFLLPNISIAGILSNLAVDYFLKLGVVSLFFPSE